MDREPDWLPEERLKAEPDIKTEQDLELAVAELSALMTREMFIHAECEKDIRRLKEQAAALMVVKVGRTECRFGERAVALSKAVEKYCNDHREQLLAGQKGKSVALSHGTIGWKATRKAVAFADGDNEKSVLKRFEERHVSKLLRTCLETIVWFGAHLGQFLNVKISLDKTGILKDFEAGKLSEKALQKAGLVISGGEDKFSLSLNEYPVRG